MNALQLIQAERAKQLSLGFSTAHDAHHVLGELSRLALARLFVADYKGRVIGLCDVDLLVKLVLPSGNGRPLYKDSRVRLLTEAAALCVAELERLLPPTPGTALDDRAYTAVAEAIGIFSRATGNVGRIADLDQRLKVLGLLGDFANHLIDQIAADLAQARPGLSGHNGHHQPETPTDA